MNWSNCIYCRAGWPRSFHGRETSVAEIALGCVFNRITEGVLAQPTRSSTEAGNACPITCPGHRMVR